MSIKQRNGIWHVDFYAPSGERIRRSAGTTYKAAAQEYHDKLKHEMWRVHNLGDTPRRSFEEACIQLLKASEGQRDYATKVRHVKYWRTVFGGRSICSLTSTEILEGLPTHRVYEDKRKPKSLTPATRNRYISTIRRILSLASEADWIVKAPKLNNLNEPAVRIRWEPQPVIRKLIDAITLDWMRDVSLFAVATGMRESEILSLTPARIDMAQCHAWVTADGAKSGYARSVPLNEDAMSVLRRRLPSAKGLIFTRGRQRDPGEETQIQQIDRRSLAKACATVGIKDFRFHDFRHTWASWHVQGGTPLMVLKELGGWETVEMVQKYAHLAPSHLAAHAGAVTFWSQGAEAAECAA